MTLSNPALDPMLAAAPASAPASTRRLRATNTVADGTRRLTAPVAARADRSS